MTASPHTRVLAFVATALVLAACLAVQTGAAAQPAMNGKLEDLPKLSVRGEAELEKPADQVRLTVGVLTENPEPAVALRENSELMRDVVKAIERSGITEDEYQTGRFRIRPTYAQRPRQPPPDWKPRIIGYEVANTIIIRTKKLDATGELIEATNRAGANTVEVSGFELSDQRRYRAEAIREATGNAIADARSLADAAGLELIRVLSITLDQAPTMIAMDRSPMAARAMAEGVGAPPITPGDITIRASVSIVYEIAHKMNRMDREQ